MRPISWNADRLVAGARFTPSSFLVVVATIGPLAVPASQSAGQSQCAGCPLSIELEPVVTLGADGAGPLLGTQTRVVRSSSGHYIAAPTYDPGVIAVYDAEGQFVRTIGRIGDGPGEFREIVDLTIAEGDTLVVTDVGQRLSIFDSDFSHVRTLRAEIPGPFFHVQSLPDAMFALQVRFREDPGLVDPIMVYTLAGEFVSAFPAPTPSGPRQTRWRMASGRRGLWLADQGLTYEILLIDAQGEGLLSIARSDLQWFGLSQPPSPGAAYGGIDSLAEVNGRLLVLGHRATRPDFWPAGPLTQDEYQEFTRKLQEWAENAPLGGGAERFIDVFDGDTGSLLHTQFFGPDVVLMQILDDGHVTVMRETVNMETVVDVRRLVIR